MKKALAVLLVVASTNAVAYRDNPNDLFDLRKEPNVTLAVTVKFADNPQRVCDAESKKRGAKGFAYQVQACAFWTDDACTIVLPKKASMHMLGHEMMHCIKGDWHPQ